MVTNKTEVFPILSLYGAIYPVLQLTFPTRMRFLPQYATVVVTAFLQLEVFSVTLRMQCDNYHVRLGAT